MCCSLEGSRTKNLSFGERPVCGRVSTMSCPSAPSTPSPRAIACSISVGAERFSHSLTTLSFSGTERMPILLVVTSFESCFSRAARGAPAGRPWRLRPMQGTCAGCFSSRASVAITLGTVAAAGARAVLPFHFGFFAPGPLDAITDVAGVRVAQSHENRRQRHPHRRDGRSAERGSVGSQGFGRFLCFQRQRRNDRDALDRGVGLPRRAGRPDRHARRRTARPTASSVGSSSITRRSDAATTCRFPVVAECDDALLNDIQVARGHGGATSWRCSMRAAPGEFARGSVGAGTGMNAFGFRAGIGSASRVLPGDAGRLSRRRARQRQHRKQPAPAYHRRRSGRASASNTSIAPVFPKKISLNGRLGRRQHHHRRRDRCAARQPPAARARAARGDGHGANGLDLVGRAAAI